MWAGFIHNAHNLDAALPRWLRLFRSAQTRNVDIRFRVSSKFGKSVIIISIMTTKQLELIATDIRQDIIKMLEAAKSGHSAGACSAWQIFYRALF